MAFEPLFFKNIDLVLGDAQESTQFKCQVKSAKLSPDVNIVKEKTACPTGQYAEVEDPEWTLEVGYLVGRDKDAAAKALAEYLRVHAGQKVPFALRPWSGQYQGGYKGKVTIIPGELGGELGSFASSSVKLPLDGQPVPLTSAEAAADAPAVFS